MCGRYNLTTPASVIAALFDADPSGLPELRPRYNIAPTQEVLAVREDERGRRLVMLRWGLIPSWARSWDMGLKTINARSEGVEAKPAFRHALRQRRCLIPANGFYEWKKIDAKRKQPMHITVTNGEGSGLLAMAGLWERWRVPEGLDRAGETVDTCTILTCPPNALMGAIHDRMPVILGPEDWGLWLDTQVQEPAAVLPLLRPSEAARMRATAVSRAVNSPGNDTPDCIRPERDESAGLFG